MAEVYYRPEFKGPPKPPDDGGTEPPDNDDMEPRIKKLEDFAQDTRDRLARIETRMDSMATKEDLHRELGAQTWRLVGLMVTFGTLLASVVYFIARNVH